MMNSDEHDARDAGEPTGAPMIVGEPGDPTNPPPRPHGAMGVPRRYSWRFFTGLVVFIGGSYAIILALIVVARRYPALNLNVYIQPPQAHVFVLSGMTWENLIFFLAIIGLWLLLRRLGLTPGLQPNTSQLRRGAFGSGNPLRNQDPYHQHYPARMTDGRVNARHTSTIIDDSTDSNGSDERDDRSE